MQKSLFHYGLVASARPRKFNKRNHHAFIQRKIRNNIYFSKCWLELQEHRIR